MERLPILISYWYKEQIDWEFLEENEDVISLFIDCGEFSAFKQGKHVNMDSYLSFIADMQNRFSSIRFFALDSIGNQEKTLENLREMVSQGFKPVPIFTRSNDFSPLEEMYSYSDLIALGGLGSGGKNDDGYVKGFMKHVDGRRVHWLGFSKANMVVYFKPYSVDNSEWSSVLRFGSLTVWHREGKIRINRADFHKRSSIQVFKLIEELGFDPQDLHEERNWRGSYPVSAQITITSFLKYIIELESRVKTLYYPVINDTLRLVKFINLFRKLKGVANG